MLLVLAIDLHGCFDLSLEYRDPPEEPRALSFGFARSTGWRPAAHSGLSCRAVAGLVHTHALLYMGSFVALLLRADGSHGHRQADLQHVGTCMQ